MPQRRPLATSHSRRTGLPGWVFWAAGGGVALALLALVAFKNGAVPGIPGLGSGEVDLRKVMVEPERYDGKTLTSRASVRQFGPVWQGVYMVSVAAPSSVDAASALNLFTKDEKTAERADRVCRSVGQFGMVIVTYRVRKKAERGAGELLGVELE